MTELEQFEMDYERSESDRDMHHSVYFIPEHYQEEDNAI